MLVLKMKPLETNTIDYITKLISLNKINRKQYKIQNSFYK